MKIYRKIKIKNNEAKSRIINIFGLPFLRVDIKKNSDGSKNKNFSFPFLVKEKKDKEHSYNNRVFYLKVNRNDNYTFTNLQHWIDIIEAMNGKFYIICDNEKLKENILNRVCFASPKINFIKSCKNKKLQNIVKNIATGFWKNATYAHLTTFQHAKKHGIINFWNIDADDTAFCIDPVKCVEALSYVEHYACMNNVNLFSLDMWRSSTHGRHWSFGITFVRGNDMVFDVIEKHCSRKWKDKYGEYVVHYNLDWYLNYLKENKYLSVETFYIENCMFFHCGDTYNVIGSHASFWHEGKIYYPVMSEVYGDKNLGVLDISPDCIKFDIGLQKEYCQNYALKNLTFLSRMPEQLRKLHNISNELCINQ